MSKISKKIMAVLALSLVFVMIFAGCTSTEQESIGAGSPNALVESNGGLTVKQGEFIYYINGLTAVADIKTQDDNTFGKVVKGAIMRGKLDKNGNLVDKSVKVVVPLMCLSGNKNGGINIFGEWIYYASPSVKMDKYEALQTSYLEFKRTKIDGTVTQDIALVDGQSTEYKFTKDAFVYFTNGELKRVSYDNEKVGKEEVIADKVSSVLFPYADENKADKVPIDNVVFYTKASENDKDMFNITYAVGTKAGSEPKAIIDGKSYDKTGKDKKQQYTITLKFVNVVADGIEVYYEKANSNNIENKAGIFGAMYKKGVLDVKNEVRFTGEPQATVYPVSLEKGLYVLQDNKLTLRRESVSETGLITFYNEDDAIELPSGATVVDFIKYKFANAEEAVDSVLFLNGNKFQIRPMSNAKNNATIILSKDNDYAVDSSWLMPEVVAGKVYFFNTNFYKYMEALDVTTGTLVKNKDGKLLHPLANLNEADAKAEKEKAEAEKKEENK